LEIGNIASAMEEFGEVRSLKSEVLPEKTQRRADPKGRTRRVM